MCTTLPIEVKVTAWQYGNKNEPKIQSAKPVSRIFKIIK